jgi:hypothetical protein
MPKKKEKEEPKNVPMKAPETESTPLKFWKNEDDEHLSVAIAPNKDGSSADFMETLKSVTGVKDTELAAQILTDGIVSLKTTCSDKDAYNLVLQTLNDLQPKDAVEARFAVQASALFSHGMLNLRKAATSDMMCHADHYSNRAIKLLRLHNETIEALNRYRRGGEQKVTVTHAVITEKAIVNNFNGVGGVSTKNEGGSPCSSQNAAQKPEQMTISHADNQQWPTVDADCMEVKASALKQKKAESA